MKLDKRIIEGKKPLDCFDTEIAKQFIGKKGYFADNDYAFIDITSDDYPISYATLTSVDEFHRIAFYDNFDVRHYYFLPEEWVDLKKKYRPLTDEEFLNLYDLGKLHSIRRVDVQGRYILTDVYFGKEDRKEKASIFVCFNSYSKAYSLTNLFKDGFEYFDGKEWKPFGVEEE